MQKQRKQQKAMLAGLQNGAEVVTSGGMIGTIVAIDEDKLVLRVKPDNVKIQVTRVRWRASSRVKSRRRNRSNL